ncbi:metacaspase-9-like [Silene latifolia]|uniref:metacaspase-9-like n=1 Tax=Silene latifolia TaxID=37657 RepID=UPI003D7790EA
MKGGKRMAVLAGCNYAGRGSSELKGCINDVVSMKKVLISSFGFKENDIVLLTDNEAALEKKPTGANIKNALERMIKQAEDGDLLVFHFSGHGTLLRDKNHGAIVPTDFNIITDMDFRQLVNKIHHKASFTIVADSCHSGGLIYQEKEQIGPSTVPTNPQIINSYKPKYIPIEDIENMFRQQSGRPLNIGDFMRLYFRDDASASFIQPPNFQSPNFQPPNFQSPNFQPNFKINLQPNIPFSFNIGKVYDNGILFSGCQSNECSLDDSASKPPHGMFSYAVMTVLQNSGKVVSNRQLVMQTRKFLGDTQHPCLYSSDENADATFLLQRQASTN